MGGTIRQNQLFDEARHFHISKFRRRKSILWRLVNSLWDQWLSSRVGPRKMPHSKKTSSLALSSRLEIVTNSDGNLLWALLYFRFAPNYFVGLSALPELVQAYLRLRLPGCAPLISLPFPLLKLSRDQQNPVFRWWLCAKGQLADNLHSLSTAGHDKSDDREASMDAWTFLHSRCGSVVAVFFIITVKSPSLGITADIQKCHALHLVEAFAVAFLRFIFIAFPTAG